MSKRKSFKDVIQKRIEDNKITDIKRDNILTIDLESIIVDEQIRKKIDEEKIIELAESIKRIGLINPITVQYDKNLNKFRLIAGERRYLAFKYLGYTHITANVIGIENETQKTLIQLEENTKRENLTTYEKSTAILTILKGYFLEKSGTDLTPLKLLSILEKLEKESRSTKLAPGTDETIKNENNSTKTNHEINNQINKIEQLVGADIRTIIRAILPLTYPIDHKKYMHEHNVPLHIFEMMRSIKNQPELIKKLLDKYLQGHINTTQIKMMVQSLKTKEQEKPKKRISLLKNVNTIIKKIDEMDLTLQDNVSVRKKNELLNKLEETKSKIDNIINKLKEN